MRRVTTKIKAVLYSLQKELMTSKTPYNMYHKRMIELITAIYSSKSLIEIEIYLQEILAYLSEYSSVNYDFETKQIIEYFTDERSRSNNTFAERFFTFYRALIRLHHTLCLHRK